MTLGENIKHLRESRGMSIEAFAESMGVEPYKVFIWERGTAKPEVTKLMEIADFFGVSLDEISGDGVPESEAYRRPAPVPKPKKEKKNSSVYTAFLIVLAVLGVLSIPLTLFVDVLSIDGALGIWPVFLCCLIPLACLAYGIIGQCKGYQGLADIIIGGFALLLCLFISVSSAFAVHFISVYSAGDDADFIAIAEEKTGLDLPGFENAVGWIYEYDPLFDAEGMNTYDGGIVYVDFSAELSEDDEETFIAAISENEGWIRGIPTQLTPLAPVSYVNYDAEYILILNVDTGEYNCYPEKSGLSRFVCLTYDVDDNLLEYVEYEKQINLG